MHGMVLQATVQRANIYRPGTPAPLRIAFRDALRRELDRLAQQYLVPVSDKKHVANIETLANAVSEAQRSALRGGRFRIGPSQKALNLFLKYLWAAGWIPEPPHCPLDRIIISRFPVALQRNWTDLDDISEYRRLIDEARRNASTQSLSLAVWELRTYHTATTPPELRLLRN